MSDVSQGPGWWTASDGKWYPPELHPNYVPPPPPPPPGAVEAAPPAVQECGPRGARITVRVLLAIGFLLLVGGGIVYLPEESHYETCTSVNNFTNGLTSPENCSATSRNIALVVAIVGLALIVVGFIVRYAERSTR